MSTQSGGRISGGEFKLRREALGMTKAQMAIFARVGTGTLDLFEKGDTDPRPEQYWQMVEVLQQLEAGETVTLTARRAKTRGGAVIIARMIAEDVDAMNRTLDEIADEDG